MTNTEKLWPGVGLLLVDIQYDFIDGTLAVKDAESILPTVRDLINNCPFQLIISSQDFHPPSHISFASRHSTSPFQARKLPHPIPVKAAAGSTIGQMMWPDHCIQGTRGCQFHSEVSAALAEKTRQGRQVITIQKGQDSNVDGYSAFSANDYVKFTELPKILFSQSPPIHTIVVVGLATDYCVLSSAVDAAKFQLRTIVVQDGVRGVDDNSTSIAFEEMKSWGIEVVQSAAEVRALMQK